MFSICQIQTSEIRIHRRGGQFQSDPVFSNWHRSFWSGQDGYLLGCSDMGDDVARILRRKIKDAFERSGNYHRHQPHRTCRQCEESFGPWSVVTVHLWNLRRQNVWCLQNVCRGSCLSISLCVRRCDICSGVPSQTSYLMTLGTQKVTHFLWNLKLHWPMLQRKYQVF